MHLTSEPLEDMSSLQKLLDLKPSAIYPGHGPHIDNQAMAAGKIEEYIQHRLEREKQIVQTLEQLSSGISSDHPGITARQIVEVLYAGLGMGVYIAAEKPVTAHLRKLEKDGRVAIASSGKWKLLP
jgi:glyoxylase-like metal-dependent hydrolase (beta-lactamase superfamily II)